MAGTSAGTSDFSRGRSDKTPAGFCELFEGAVEDENGEREPAMGHQPFRERRPQMATPKKRGEKREAAKGHYIQLPRRILFGAFMARQKMNAAVK